MHPGGYAGYLVHGIAQDHQVLVRSLEASQGQNGVSFFGVQTVKAIQRWGSRKDQRTIVLDGPEDGRLWVSSGTALERGIGAELHGLARRTLDEFRGGYSVSAGSRRSMGRLIS